MVVFWHAYKQVYTSANFRLQTISVVEEHEMLHLDRKRTKIRKLIEKGLLRISITRIHFTPEK